MFNVAERTHHCLAVPCYFGVSFWALLHCNCPFTTTLRISLGQICLWLPPLGLESQHMSGWISIFGVLGGSFLKRNGWQMAQAGVLKEQLQIVGHVQEFQ